MVEPPTQRCNMLMRRPGLRRTPKDPREIISVVRSLKSGSQVYAIANITMSRTISDEGFMKLTKEEVAFVFSTFSAYFVVVELYDMCTYWRMPIARCICPYENVEVEEPLVDCLGVSMERTSRSEYSVE